MNKKYALILILILAASLRLYGLSRGDTLSDEVFYAFRAVGPLDFDEAELQTTPLEWFDPRTISRHCDPKDNDSEKINLPAGLAEKICDSAIGTGVDPDIPSWTKFSFHDHPPLVFWVQHFSIKTFGETNFGFRLPSALLGIASVFLIYLIGNLLYGKNAGLIASVLFAATANNILIARTGLQESYVIFFILLSSWFFLKALEKDKYLLWLGISLGLSLLTKYTTTILIPIFFTYLLIYRRNYFLNKKLWLGTLLAILIFSPVIIYNFNLYKTVGHLDFQLSSVLGERPEVWQVQPGKEIGTISERIKNYPSGLYESNSWIFLALASLTALFFLKALAKNAKETLSRHAFLLMSLAWFASFMLAVGPSFRFLSMLTAFLALASGFFMEKMRSKFFKNKLRLAVAFLVFFILWEAAYSINTAVFHYPKGPEIWAWSPMRLDNYSWGYNELADYLKEELSGKMPAIAFEPKYSFISKFQEKSLKSSLDTGLEEYPALIVYDGNVQTAAQLWVLDRLQVYHAWPVINMETYLSFLEQNGFDYFDRVGFKTRYFIIPTDKVPQKQAEKLTNLGRAFEEGFRNGGAEPLSIRNKRGEEAFRVYKFTPGS